uniref:30S ribosomal protein S5 n=1 Tax=Nephromyces sp. ex Molgula occidentalis TaxID=2544991 RepID=A0A5C1H8F6_9APIC|nr:30S ribosomal protein S5 [Nephromyces sp. ex Molgula occidentalis]
MLLYIKFNNKNFSSIKTKGDLKNKFTSFIKFNYLTFSILEFKFLLYIYLKIIILFNNYNKFYLIQNLFKLLDILIINKILYLGKFQKNYLNFQKYKFTYEVNLSKSLNEIKYKILDIQKISKTTKKGRTKKFKIILVSGNYNLWFGIGVGKHLNFNEAVEKAYKKSLMNIYKINLENLKNISNIKKIKFKQSKLFFRIRSNLKFNIKSSSLFKSIFELAGIKNITLKIIGSRNKLNSIKVFLQLLKLSNNFNNISYLSDTYVENINTFLNLNNILNWFLLKT